MTYTLAIEYTDGTVSGPVSTIATKAEALRIARTIAKAGSYDTEAIHVVVDKDDVLVRRFPMARLVA